MFGRRNMFDIMLPALVLFFIFLIGMIYVSNDSKVELNIEKSYKQELDFCKTKLQECDDANEGWIEHYDRLKEDKEVICKCPENKFNILLGISAFFIGAISCGYFILFGYPLLQKKLKQKHEKKGD